MHVTPTSDPSEPQLRETVSGDAAHDPLLTNRQAAAEIGVSVPTFYVMLKERQLPAAIYVRSNRHAGGVPNCAPRSRTCRAATRTK